MMLAMVVIDRVERISNKRMTTKARKMEKRIATKECVKQRQEVINWDTLLFGLSIVDEAIRRGDHSTY